MATKDKYFPIDKIVDKRNRKGKTEYLIKWKGFSSKHNSWEPENFLLKDTEQEREPNENSTKAASKTTTKKTSTEAAAGETKSISNKTAPRTSTKMNNTNIKAETTEQTNAKASTQQRWTKVNGEKYFDIEKILAKRIVNNKVQYLVHWKGYGTDESTWEPEVRLKSDYSQNCCNLLKNAFV